MFFIPEDMFHIHLKDIDFFEKHKSPSLSYILSNLCLDYKIYVKKHENIFLDQNIKNLHNFFLDILTKYIIKIYV